MVDNKEQLKDFLRKSVLNNLERGHWRFRSAYPCTDVRISDSSLAQNSEAWCHLLADLVSEHPSGAIVTDQSYNPEDVRWLPRIAQVFESRGIEIPFTEIVEELDINHTWGVDPKQYPEGFPVSVFTNVNTLGGHLRYLKRTTAIFFPNLRVINALSLVDRNPIPMTEIDGVPHFSVLHIQLPLYINEQQTRRAGTNLNWTSVLRS